MDSSSTPRPCCPVGARDDAAQIDAALLTGDSIRTVVAAFGSEAAPLSFTAVQKHRAHALAEDDDGPRSPKSDPNQRGKSPGIGPKSWSKSAPGQNPGDDARTAPRKLITAAIEERAVDLRIAGKSFAAIGAELGIDGDTAMDAVERVLVRTIGKADRKADLAREIEVRRCDAIIAAFWDRATDPSMVEVDVPADTESGVRKYDGQDKAADRLLKAMERRSKLLGLDAPTGPSVQVNILNSPEFNAILGAIVTALRGKHPEALADVMAVMRGQLAEMGQAHGRPRLVA